MRIPRTRLAVTAVIAAALLTSGMIAAATASAATPGYTWIGSGTYAIYPSGLKVYVVKGSHTTSMTAAAKYTIAQQRRYGIKVSWGGYSTTHTRTHAVVIYQAANCPGSLAGLTTTTNWNSGSVPGPKVISDATIKMCPIAFQNALTLRSVTLHEAAHAVGLGHFAGSYRGHKQIMNPMVQSPPLQTYQAGDVNGLRAIATNTARIAVKAGK